MDKQRVLAALETLRAELADAEGLDEASRAQLERVTDDVERQLASGARARDDDSEPLAGRLQDAVQEFGAEHPQITGAVNQVAAALANLGI
jgi:hypothetical protein